MALIALLDAARHLRLDVSSDPYWENTDEAQDVALKLTISEETVLDYLKNPDASAYWDEDTTPGPVQGAVLLVLSDFWEHRAGSASDDVFLSAAAKSLLHRYRDPALA